MIEEHFCDYRMPGNFKNSSTCKQYHLKTCTGPHLEKSIKINADLCSINNSSASSTMSQVYTPTFVYNRKRRKTDDVSRCSKVPSVVSKENLISFFERASKACSSRDALLSANENCLSSKSNLDSSSLKNNMGCELGECSSSSTLLAQKVPKEMSEVDICMSILKSQGLVDNRSQDQAVVPNGDTDFDDSEKYCSKSCKKCGKLEHTSNLLICDNCEDAFHIPCCSPRIIRIPAGEWHCSSCNKKKHMILRSACNSVDISCDTSEDELGPLGFMFTDTEPYMSDVRVGDEFQASVPNWSIPIEDSSDLIGEPLEMDASNNVSMQELNSTKALKLGSIGNWLQCRAVIGDEEIVCGKWRRAPLFEVQSDKWDCFSCILWDPAHADCAAPQEEDTAKVMKQLKYIEMLRPRIATKIRRKSGSSKSSSSPDDKIRRKVDSSRKKLTLL